MPVKKKFKRIPKKFKRYLRGGSTERTKTNISQKTEHIKELWGKGRLDLFDQIEMGALLTYQKEAVVIGKWIKWVETRLPFSERTARAYVKLNKAFRFGWECGLDHGYGSGWEAAEERWFETGRLD